MSQVVVLAPHPDDEVLGCASVLVEHHTVVVHVTDGVPPNVTGDAAVVLRDTRDQEAREACEVLDAQVDRFVALGVRDQELWCNTSEVADALVALISTLDCETVYVPAFQNGHPDHDGLYVAAQLARAAVGNDRLSWTCYALYALNDHGAPGYGWLHPSVFPLVTEHVFSTEKLDRKSRALRRFVTQVSPESVVQSWLNAPTNEWFAPLPPRHATIPPLRSYYEEIFRFGEQGIDRGTVDRVLKTALAGS